MMELEMLVLQKGPNAKVFPVCYTLNFEDLKNPENLSRWRSKWETFADHEQQADLWGKALKALTKFNGEIFIPKTSEMAYVEKVVHGICAIVPCPVPYDLPWMQGQQRLNEEVAGIFSGVKASCPKESACMVGLHGVGGLGKTTVCMSMVNYYTTQYIGRSCLIEFPSDGDKSKIVQECKAALKKLTGPSSKYLPDEINSFEQVISLMSDHAKRYDVFLAIDNVWAEASQEAAERLLHVGFSAGSKILLTSRSQQVLKELLSIEHTSTSCVSPLPAPEYEEALAIFQNTFKLVALSSGLVDKNQMSEILEKCRFHGIYHVLALKALAQHVRTFCEHKDLENMNHHLSVVLDNMSNSDLQTVEKLIRLQYQSLTEEMRHMFLHTAVLLVPQNYAKRTSHITYTGLHQFFNIVYNEFRETRITTLIHDLASSGLIQIEAGKDGEKAIRVHDLFMDLAGRELAISPRFLLPYSTSSVEKLEWQNLESVILLNEDWTCLFEKPHVRKCRKIRVLIADSIRTKSKICVNRMPSLRILQLRSVSLTNEKMKRFAAMILGQVVKLNGLAELRLLQIDRCDDVEKIRGLDTLGNLESLTITKCSGLKELDGLSGLIRLETLEVEECENLKAMSPTLVEWPSRLWRIHKPMEEELGGSLSPTLKRVRVNFCGALEKMPDVSGLTRLEHLMLCGNDALEEVGGEYLNSRSLRDLCIFNCKRLSRYPSCFRTDCINLQKLGGSQRIINDSLVSGKLPNLLRLVIEDSAWTSNLFNEQWKHAPLLQNLRIRNCGALMKLEVGCLSRLRTLWVEKCEALEEVSGLHCLEQLSITDCPRVRNVGGLVGISTHLTVDGCGSLKEIALVAESVY